MKKALFTILYFCTFYTAVTQTLNTSGSFLKYPENGSNQETVLQNPNYRDSFKKFPYLLYVGANDQMKIMWQLNGTEDCTLDYGTDTAYSSGSFNVPEYNNDHQHKITLTALTPDQKYYYKVTCANGTSRTGSFQTGALDNASEVTFFVYGDTRSNPGDHDHVAEQMMLDIAQNDLKQTFVINTGDLVSNGDDENSWQNEFFNRQYTHITEMLANLPFVAALGNHEGQGILFDKYFEYPIFMNNDFYYSFDYGPVHILIIDTETSFSPGSQQYNWIVNDLSSSDKPWKIASFHRPGWSAGTHSNNSSVQAYLQPLFEQYNVNFVITGHNHYYSRAEVNGMEHITTGGGGAPLYNPNNSYPYILITDKSNHYCKLEITGNTLHFTAIRSDGSIIEQFDKETTAANIENRTVNDNRKVFSVNGKIIVETKGQNGGFVEIYDNLGRMLFRKKIINKKTEFNIHQTGTYFVRKVFDGKFIVKKIIVTHL